MACVMQMEVHPPNSTTCRTRHSARGGRFGGRAYLARFVWCSSKQRDRVLAAVCPPWPLRRQIPTSTKCPGKHCHFTQIQRCPESTKSSVPTLGLLVPGGRPTASRLTQTCARPVASFSLVDTSLRRKLYSGCVVVCATNLERKSVRLVVLLGHAEKPVSATKSEETCDQIEDRIEKSLELIASAMPRVSPSR
ncbi:hypothetical protein DOTSEDRAFT_78038 [Dothistroma septosporum NZE10]|uniref:Uncharacterized protein n=1 Tax=Dothistroma septosporum (strain NZE10 / CBS 128990) TaxID=675120 RepID=N1PWR4_DOTSN|nr:hypothetical protein DOTSEDRAFT_78038 [Dothistroma septosporum NZE10]